MVRIGDSGSEKNPISVRSFVPEKEISSKHEDQPYILKKTYDHTPHEVFVELEELQQTTHGNLEWKETARWIKYEEDVVGMDSRWGKPHIAFLNFNALFHLRKGLEQGSLLLDLEEYDLHSIANRVAEHLVSSNQIPPHQKESVTKVLLLRHKHTKEGSSAFRRASRITVGSGDDELNTVHSTLSSHSARSSARKTLATMFRMNNLSPTSIDGNAADDNQPSRRNSLSQLEVENETENKEKISINIDLLKKLPINAEAVAVLIGSLDFLTQPVMAFVRLAEGVFMENLVEVPLPVRFIFILLGPYDVEMDYREIGRSFSTLMSDKSFHEVAYKAYSRVELLVAISEFLNASIVFPPSEWKSNDLVPIDEIRNKAQEIRKRKEERKTRFQEAKIATPVKTDEPEDIQQPLLRNPLERKGKPFYGLIQDVKIRYSQYWSDLRDGLSTQVLSACIFIFFAALSPAVTFGGIYGNETNKYIGVGETLLVSSINGVIFGLFAAQPLLIVGSTGPLMIFDISLLKFCNEMDLDYLSLRVWVGIWILVIGVLVAAFEAVAIVKNFTRFTEETFSTLVCTIFIYQAFENLFIIFNKHPLLPNKPCFIDLNNTQILNSETLLMNGKLINVTNICGNGSNDEVNQPNTALLSMFLMIGTFLIAWKLREFRNSKFLSRGVRRALGHFGVPIAIFLMVLVDFLIKDTFTDKLSMPEGLQPSKPEIRGWFINPLGVIKPLPLWCIAAAAPAALLLFILIFLEENICHLILSKPERCLKKGSGFHLDLVLSCLINTVAGFLGAPFMGPACVRTIAHTSALTVMSSNVAPGESPKVVGCIEQRVSAIVVSILIGLAVMLYAILNFVPTAVLLGIFLYMGISATAGIQLLERVVLFFMPAKNYPNVPYVKYVKTLKMHTFTAIQVLMLIILWAVKQSPASLAIPFVLVCLIPIRLYLLPYIFTPTELIALDGVDQAPEVENADDEPDFYETAHDLPTQIEADSLHHS